jgi:ribosomal-protein-alanine N-acetyltransferase
MQDDKTLLGYAVLMPLPDEVELLNITIAPSQQQRGLGRQLLDRICSDASKRGAQRMFLEVRASNLPARTLYERSGFVEIGLRKNYYAAHGGQRENAILMARELQAND